MKPLINPKFILPLGLLLMSVTLILKNFNLLPAFLNGFLMGLAISFIIGSFIRKWYVKRTN